MYASLNAGKLPRLSTSKTLLDLGLHWLKSARFRSDELANATAELVRPLRVIKSIDIEGTEFSGYRFKSSNAYIAKSGDEVSYTGLYKNLRASPITGRITQAMNTKKDEVVVLFMPSAPFKFESKYVVTDPGSLRCSSEVLAAAGIFRYDRISEAFNIGVLDDRYKPVSEYPVSGADDVVLDIAYDWSVENLVYPLPLPSGLKFKNMSASFQSGFYPYEGKNYKDHATNNIIRAKATIKNNTGATIRVTHWGAPLSVLYEDLRHVSQIDVNVSFPSRNISNGGTYSYYIDINLPRWCYGRVALAHALNVYKGGMYIYGGGPLWQFEVFRLRLP